MKLSEAKDRDIYPGAVFEIEALPPLREDHHGVIPHISGSLRDIETTLVALIEIDPEELTPELRAKYERDLQEAIRKAPEKRERVAMKLFDLGQRAAVKRAAAQAYRDKAATLDGSADRFERDAERLKNYVLDVMRELPKPARGVRTLEGTSATFKAKGVADSAVIDDEALVPLAHKEVSVKMPANIWDELKLAITTLELGQMNPSWSVSRSSVKAALQEKIQCAVCGGSGGPADLTEYGGGDNEPCPTCEGTGQVMATVPGARLLTDKLRLEVS